MPRLSSVSFLGLLQQEIGKENYHTQGDRRANQAVLGSLVHEPWCAGIVLRGGVRRIIIAHLELMSSASAVLEDK